MELMGKKKRGKSLKLVPTVGLAEPQEIIVPDDKTIGEAIGYAYGNKLKGKRLLLTNEKDEAVSADTSTSDCDTVKITPWTDGGQ